MPALATGCVVSLTPDQTLNKLGSTSNVTFICGTTAKNFTGPAANPYPQPGCFDLEATVTDGTTGSQLSFNQVICGGLGNGANGNCMNVLSSLCATGYLVSDSNQQCEPCPPNFTYDAGNKTCTIAPVNGVCPPNTTAVTNGGKVPIACTEPLLDNTPQEGNEVQMVVEATSPHVVTVTVTGYVGTSAAGYCPAGTTLTPGVIPTAGSPAPGCAFSLTVQENYLEVNNISLIRESTCGGTFNPSLAAIAGDEACFILIKVTGMVILKEGVDCSTEPSGTQAPSPEFSGDPVTNIVPTYDCSDGTLRIINVPAPDVQVQLTASNGTFPTDCLPQALTPKPIGTPVPTGTATPTDTPTPTPTPTPDTAVTPTPTPTPPPIVGFEDPAFCIANNSSSTETVVTDQYGLVGYNGDTVSVSATTTTPSPTSVGIAGQFELDGAPLADIPAWATLHFPSVDSTIPCGTTDGNGNTSCTANVSGSSPGDLIPIDVSGIYNCEEYGIKTYVYVGETGVIAGPVPLAAQQGLCVLRSYAGAVTLTATIVSNLNTQPAVSAGPITLGTYGFATATPIATNTPAPVPTSTPVPTATNTPIPTSTPTSTPTPTPTNTPLPTATATATIVHTLRFSFDAARVDRAGSKGTKAGLNVLTGGRKVWLMMYYTVKDLTGPTKRTTTYALWYGSQLIFKQSFAGSEMSPGSSVRYLPLQLPAGLTPGIYTFQATLQLGKVIAYRSWRCVVVAVPGIAT